jgi:hypothetical protein
MNVASFIIVLFPESARRTGMANWLITVVHSTDRRQRQRPIVVG